MVNLLPVWSHSGINTFWRAGDPAQTVSSSKTLFLVTLTLHTQTMFSMLVFMCTEPGDSKCIVSCCVVSCFDASVPEPHALR